MGIPCFNTHASEYKKARRQVLLLVWMFRYRKTIAFDEEAVIEHCQKAWKEDLEQF